MIDSALLVNTALPSIFLSVRCKTQMDCMIFLYYSSSAIRFTVGVMTLFAIVSGCARYTSPRRPNIHQLIQDAIEHSAEQPQGVIASDPLCENFGSNPKEPGGFTDSNVFRTQLEGLAEDALTGPEHLAAPLPIPPLPAPPQADLLSEEFIETDVREAIFLLAEEANVEVLLDEQVRGVVNISLTDVTFEQGLEKILLPLNYVFVHRDGQYLIAPPDPKSPLFHLIAQQREYRPLHLTPKALLDTTPKTMKHFVHEVEGANSILIYAPKQYAELLLKQYAKLDQPIPQVILEAIICVVSPDCGFRFGVNWGHAVELNGTTALDLGVSGLAINTQFSPTGFDAIFRDFSTTSFFIRKLAEHGYLTIRAAPRVMAQDGKQAHIAINRETFFTVQPFPTGSDGDNNSFFFQQDIQKVESGISLDITPHIRGDTITVEIDKAEVSEDIRNSDIENAVNPFPIISRRSVSTTVTVKNGRTIVIGGLVQRETVDRITKIPGLSNLPGVGRLFKNTQTQTREVEVVIFISPKIVDPCQECTASIIPNSPISLK